jgi:hypothetical protein
MVNTRSQKRQTRSGGRKVTAPATTTTTTKKCTAMGSKAKKGKKASDEEQESVGAGGAEGKKEQKPKYVPFSLVPFFYAHFITCPLGKPLCSALATTQRLTRQGHLPNNPSKSPNKSFQQYIILI